MEKEKQHFNYLKIKLASPNKIYEWGQRQLPNGKLIGEVTEAETINYRTLKPEQDGLFCERIFGPVTSWECYCGKSKQKRGLFCEICGVEITDSRVRRHRMGHIKLLTPVVHIWYLKGSPSYLATILNEKVSVLEEEIYGNEEEEDIFTVQKNTNVDEDFFIQEKAQGAEILFKQLKRIDLKQTIEMTRYFMMSSKSNKAIKDAIKRIRILEHFLATEIRPEWMILNIIPVLPPSLRPMVQLENGKFATSDLNELYRKIIIRNKRLGKLFSICAPDVVIGTEKRLVQEAVDALIDNGKRGPQMMDIHKRPLKSLADTIEGKQGRFRQNLLGKRVDYSGRSVIIVGPNLKLNQCGLPYELAVELFLPFLMHRIIYQGLAGTIKKAKKIIYYDKSFIWNVLKSLLKKHPIFLNRAPTLHRLGVQSFDAILVRGRAIQLHPLVCPAFNADFDGDQMAVHIPLSLEAQIESKLCMLAPNNFLSPATGEPIIQPTQDMILGFYYLTTFNQSKLTKTNQYFANFDIVISAYQQNKLNLHASIWVRYFPPLDNSNIHFYKIKKLLDGSTLKLSKNLQIRQSKSGEIIVQYIRTTPGRIIFNQAVKEIINKNKN
uniref:DNA-directed RNA polymerase subunit beta' n=1 Tax=Schizocladia ischiensis TaxID=196139 RepID=A0A7S6U9W9_9STRA|nr:RNA polymerase beta' subunit [Schizocladia ischiensis]QOW07523.1 RNA polymerase beta' subunit [Schizocladia ischiensis]